MKRENDVNELFFTIIQKCRKKYMEMQKTKLAKLEPINIKRFYYLQPIITTCTSYWWNVCWRGISYVPKNLFGKSYSKNFILKYLMNPVLKDLFNFEIFFAMVILNRDNNYGKVDLWISPIFNQRCVRLFFIWLWIEEILCICLNEFVREE